MRATPRHPRQSRHQITQAVAVESLEDRRLLSAVLTHDFNTKTSQTAFVIPSGEFAFSNGRIIIENSSAGGGRNLYTSDGTSAGTKPLNTTELTGYFLVSGNKLFYSARSNVKFVGPFGTDDQSVLWVTDGTAAGTHELDSNSYLKVGTSAEFRGLSSPGSFIAGPNGSIYFQANFSGSSNLAAPGFWISDGTLAGTREVSSAFSIINPIGAVVGSTLYFPGRDSTHAFGLFKTGGTAATTSFVADANLSLVGIGAVGTEVFFEAAGGSIYRSNGTSAGTSQLTGGYFLSSAFVNVGSKMFFSTNNGGSNELAYVTATSTTPTIVMAKIGGSKSGILVPAGPMVAFKNALYFGGGYFANKFEGGLFKTDGTAAGTALINGVNIASSAPLVVAQNRLFTVGNTNPSAFPTQLWVSDGTAAGTKEAVALPSTTQGLISAGSAVYFVITATDGMQLWVAHAPTSANAGSTYTVTQGGTVTLAASATDIDPKETFTYKWDLNGNGIFGETGAAATNGNETGKTPIFSAAKLGTKTSETVSLEAFNSLGLSSPIVTAVVHVIPKAASSLTTSVASHHVTLKWKDNSKIETGYKIQRSSDGKTFTTIKTVASNLITFTDTTTTAGTKYYYRVIAADAFGSGLPTNVVAVTA